MSKVTRIRSVASLGPSIAHVLFCESLLLLIDFIIPACATASSEIDKVPFFKLLSNSP